jgi:hypothetical protein
MLGGRRRSDDSRANDVASGRTVPAIAVICDGQGHVAPLGCNRLKGGHTDTAPQGAISVTKNKHDGSAIFSVGRTAK